MVGRCSNLGVSSRAICRLLTALILVSGILFIMHIAPFRNKIQDKKDLRRHQKAVGSDNNGVDHNETRSDLKEILPSPAGDYTGHNQPGHTVTEWCSYLKRNYKINPHRYRFLMSGASVCAEGAPYILLVVNSLCGHIEKRQAVRETWGSVVHTGRWADGQKLPQTKLIFVFGRVEDKRCLPKLKREAEIFGDIVSSDFFDSYRNITIKTISVMKWIVTFCPKVQYILKFDEDTFPHIPRWVDLIKVVDSPKTLIGFVDNISVPSVSGRWRVNVYEYPFRFYPTYLWGSAIMIPGYIVRPMLELSEYFPLFPLEDAFITGILAPCAGAKLWLGQEYDTYGEVMASRYNEEMLCFLRRKNHRLAAKCSSTADLYLIWMAEKNASMCKT